MDTTYINNNNDSFVIEENYNFFEELSKELNSDTKNNNDNICMITHEPLTYNSIKLPCNHKFNYYALYNELCLHNQNKVNKKYIMCPYCRTLFDKYIPYIPLPNISKVKGVNFPLNKCMDNIKCSHIFSKGAKKNTVCSKICFEDENGIFCSKHINNTSNNENEITWNDEMENLFKTKKINELKELLKMNKMKLSGSKKELVKRLVINKYK